MADLLSPAHLSCEDGQADGQSHAGAQAGPQVDQCFSSFLLVHFYSPGSVVQIEFDPLSVWSAGGGPLCLNTTGSAGGGESEDWECWCVLTCCQ